VCVCVCVCRSSLIPRPCLFFLPVGARRFPHRAAWDDNHTGLSQPLDDAGFGDSDDERDGGAAAWAQPQPEQIPGGDPAEPEQIPGEDPELDCCEMEVEECSGGGEGGGSEGGACGLWGSFAGTAGGKEGGGGNGGGGDGGSGDGGGGEGGGGEGGGEGGGGGWGASLGRGAPAPPVPVAEAEEAVASTERSSGVSFFDDDMLTPTGYPPPNTAAGTAHSAHSTQPALRPHRATPRVEDNDSLLSPEERLGARRPSLERGASSGVSFFDDSEEGLGARRPSLERAPASPWPETPSAPHAADRRLATPAAPAVGTCAGGGGAALGVGAARREEKVGAQTQRRRATNPIYPSRYF